MFLSNDPYVGAPHQPDTIVAAPVFVGGQLFCWVANVLHHSDIGGSVVGSFCVDAADIFTDPPAFPPFKIVEGGRVRQDLEQVVPAPVPAARRGADGPARRDLGEHRHRAQKLEALIARYGADAVKTVMSTGHRRRRAELFTRTAAADPGRHLVRTGCTRRRRTPATPASTGTS